MSDERDPEVSRRYRELGGEEPPQALDRAILDAARRGTEAQHAPLVTPAGRHRWYFPLAAAAVLVLAVAITLHIDREESDTEAVPGYSTAPEVAKNDDALQPPPASGFTPDLKPEAKEPSREVRRDRATQPPDLAAQAPRAPESAARPRAPAQAPDVAAQVPTPVPQARMEEQAGRPSAQAASPLTRGAVPQARSGAPLTEETPERWLERIAQLRAQGRHDDADKALADFRRRHPDYKIPGAMLERVER